MFIAISIVCLIVMAALVGYSAVHFFGLKRKEKIEYVNGFKKGKFVIIYVVAIPLFFCSLIYDGNSVGNALLSSVSDAISLIGMKFSFDLQLMKDCAVFAAAIYTCYILVVANSVIFGISFLHQWIWARNRLRKFHSRKSGDLCIIVGCNKNSKKIYASCTCPRMIADVIGKDESKELYGSGITHKSFANTGDLGAWLLKETESLLTPMRNTKRKLNIIVNFKDKDKNLFLIGELVSFIRRQDDTAIKNIGVYVFGDLEYEDIYKKYEDDSRGCLRYLNEYDQIAIDFIDKYPLTEYMDGRHIDYETSLLKKDVKISVCMIGFGRTNQQIFLSMMAINQFLTKDESGGIVSKQVQYHYYDKDNSGKQRRLNHNYYRYKHDLKAEDGILKNKDRYLPLPELPGYLDDHDMDINDISFYDELKKDLNGGDSSINYIIVALGDVYLSIDAANKIAAKLKEWNCGCSHIFVHVRDKRIADESKYYFGENCIAFGSESGVTYDYSHIILDKFAEMAIQRDYLYDTASNLKRGCNTEKAYLDSRSSWFKLASVQRKSNIYACLALRSKLHLLGMDYVKDARGKTPVGKNEYMDIYGKGDMPEYDDSPEKLFPSFTYGLETRESKRTYLAMQEHYRWNAYMLIMGFVPATVDQIKNEKKPDGGYTDGKNFEARRHGNLTTFEGLVRFRKLIAERNHEDELKNDVIMYDYQLLDGSWWLLNDRGFTVIKRRS